MLKSLTPDSHNISFLHFWRAINVMSYMKEFQRTGSYAGLEINFLAN